MQEARQQTLRDTITWSYSLLSDSEQRLFRLLSIFVDGCTLVVRCIDVLITISCLPVAGAYLLCSSAAGRQKDIQATFLGWSGATPEQALSRVCCLIVLSGCTISRLCGKEDSESTALQSKRPRSERENGEAEGQDSIHIIAARHIRCNRAYQIDEGAGIRPLLEPRKTRHQQGDAPKRLAHSEDREQVHGVA
jgi:hypothetical protein